MSPKIEINIPLELQQEIEAYAKHEAQTTNEFIIMAISEKVGELRQRKGVKNLTSLQQTAVSPTKQSSLPINQSDPKPQATLLRASDVAKILQISKSMVYRLIQRNELPYIRIGSSVRIRKENLEKFIEANC